MKSQSNENPGPAAGRENFLEVRGVTKNFGDFTALKEVSMSASRGEFVCILGPSGCGKTTLLRVIAGLEEQNQGRVFLAGREVSQEPPAGRDLGIVFQSYALFPNINIVGNVAYGIARQRRPERRRRALEMLDLVGLSDQAEKFPAQLSGGQQQRVALARALAPNPSLLLLDEPLSALDAKVRDRLRREIRGIQQRLGITTIMVTHDQEEALTMADRVMVLKDGVLLQFATPLDLYRRPENNFVAGFIGSMNFIAGGHFRDSGSFRLAGHDLELAGGRAPGIGEQPLLAIRPEDITVVAESSPHRRNSLPARIDHIEFRGAVYRLTLSLLRPDGQPGPERFFLDLQFDQVEDLELAEEREFMVQLPPEKILLFPPEDLAGHV